MATLVNSSGKKISQQKPIQGPLVASNPVLQQREECRITLCWFKNRASVRVALDRREPSPRFPSNGIHMKSESKNLQGNDPGKGLGARQVPIKRESQKPGSLKL